MYCVLSTNTHPMFLVPSPHNSSPLLLPINPRWLCFRFHVNIHVFMYLYAIWDPHKRDTMILIFLRLT